MLKTFVFHEEKNSWSEESQLLLHDINSYKIITFAKTYRKYIF